MSDQPSFTIFSDSLDHDFVRASFCALLASDPQITVTSWAVDRLRPFTARGSRCLHLQWIDVFFRRKSSFACVSGSLKLLGYVAALRLVGVATVWTVHNPIGKAHKRHRLDRLVRSILVRLIDKPVVLNEAAVQPEADSLHRFARKRFIARACVVPIPAALRAHGPSMSPTEAQERLHLQTSLPVFAYLPGANQANRVSSFAVRNDRFKVITVSRQSSQARGLQETAWGWVFHGRPTDEEYGLLLRAANAVVLADSSAYGSMTLHSAVAAERPVVSVACPAVVELCSLGGGIQVTGELSVHSLEESALMLEQLDIHRARHEFCLRHSDERVAAALKHVYGLDSKRRGSLH